MQSCNISHQIIKSVSGYFSGAVQIDSVKPLHNICVIRNLKLRYNRLSKPLDFYIFTVIFSDRNRWIDDIRNRHHDLFDLFFYFFFFFGKSFHTVCALANLFLHLFRFFLFPLCHTCTDLFGSFIFLRTKRFYFLFDLAVSHIQFQYFIDKRKFLILKLISDILLYHLWIRSYKFNI